MAVNMDNITSALVYDYLLKIDSSMANVFRKKIKVPDLLNASPKLLDVVRIYQETNKKKVEIRVATESSDDSSSDSDDSSDDSSQKVAKPKSVINGTTEFNGNNTTVNNSDSDDSGVLPQRNVTTKLVSLSPQKVAKKPTVQNQKDSKSDTPAKAAKQASSSSEDSSSEDEDNNGKKKVTTGKQPTTIKKSSSEDSSSEEDEPTKPIMPTKSAAASKTVVKVQKSESSSEDTSSEDDKPATLGKIPVKNVVKKCSSNDISSEEKEDSVMEKKKDSSSDDSSFEGEIIANASHIAKPTTTPKKVQSSSDDSSSEEDERVKTTVRSIKSTAIVKKPELSSDSSSEEDVPAKHISKTPIVKKPESSESSNSSEDEKPHAAPVKSAPKRKLENKSIAVPIKKKCPTKSSSDSEDSSDDSASKVKVKESPTNSDSSEEESSDEDKAIQPTVQKATLAKKSESTSDENSSEDEAPTPVVVKKTPSYGNFVKAGNNQSPSTPKMSVQQLPKKINGKGQTSAGKTPFRRVREDDIIIDERVKNNSFEAKKNARGSYGEKANNDLKHTRGKQFKHEKTKKKRGSYRGGPIDMGVNSIKFDD